MALLICGSIVHAQTVKIVPVAKAWAKNSVNTAVFRKNSLVSLKDTQYIAFYNEASTVVLGKRKIGQRNWQLQTTAYKGNTSDAHNVISIMVDGNGYLHMAWDHHNNTLHYAKGIQPGSLQLGPEIPMTGKQESRVTYPEFYRLANDNLLFMYRDGSSGNGNLVINSYDITTQQWTSLQTNLIDGEGQRNAYWQACMDNRGTLHLSWVWRETPDVATNHDICYARSTDGGKTWERSTGEKYQLPITASTAEVAQPVPQGSELINQTSMFADANGNPYIATYWRPANSTIPQYQVVFKKDNNWQVQNLGFRSTAFSLSGTGTKRIPVSRPQIVAWQRGNTLSAALIFRDNERNNKVSVAVANDITKNNWKITDLHNGNVGSWEPTYDTELWKQKGLLHLFVQNVDQADAEGKTNLPPQMVEVLEWSPPTTDVAVSKASVLDAMHKANRYWQTNNPPQNRSFWDVAAYHTGNMEAYFVTGNESYRKYSETWAEHNQWMGARSTNKSEWKYAPYGEGHDYVMFGDWQICFQTYIDLYNLQPDPKKIARAKEVMEYQMSTAKNDYWWWADGLYMVMPVMTKMYKLTGNKQYLDKLHEYFSYANSIMYDSVEKLYYRDAKYVYPKHKSVNGKKDFWARGDGWVFAGLAKVLQDMPKNSPHYNEFLNKYRGMAAAIKNAQQPEGYWTRSLLDPMHAPGPETSGTAFFTYGMLWGINDGILNKKDYLPVAMKAWRYLTEVALQPDGKLGYVQPIGERAIPGQVVDKNSTSNFGVGAFLLAASEMYRHLGRPPHQQYRTPGKK